MRLVESAADLEASYDAARREAKASFGDDSIYIEKFIVRPRHVEIQILADNHGTVLHLGERECSIQRRHQKMIEEAPSIAVTPELRARLGATAVRAATAAGYTNAGTCEFLLDAKGDFYFLEMNTRLQVEHPVTELVTGIDIVQWQLRIAAGERLSMAQSDIVPRGWAIECRITSESPADGFLPSTGVVAQLRLPAGAGVRWDGGIELDTEIGPWYDPMLAKLIVWASDRPAAVARMERALRELSITGVETSREFHLLVMKDPDFLSGDFDVQWLERRLDELLRAGTGENLARQAAIVAVLLEERRRGVAGASQQRAGNAATGESSRMQREGWPRPQWNAGMQRDNA
jgi:acetyl-CoA carboxylase biotin carboxylase subunit